MDVLGRSTHGYIYASRLLSIHFEENKPREGLVDRLRSLFFRIYTGEHTLICWLAFLVLAVSSSVHRVSQVVDRSLNGLLISCYSCLCNIIILWKNIYYICILVQ